MVALTEQQQQQQQQQQGEDVVHPSRASLKALVADNPLPHVAPGIVDRAAMTGGRCAEAALAVLGALNAALAAGDAAAGEACFHPGQAYWRDSLALTWHLRTFLTGRVAAAALVETAGMRGLGGGFAVVGDVAFQPEFCMLDCALAFRTESPAATCSGRALLLPVPSGEDAPVEWKIWILSTRLENLDVHPENEGLLRSPGMGLDDNGDFETDVLIVGAGNAAASLAARLKALGVGSVMVERNARVGDNLALRYDSLSFHVPTAYAHMPYLHYDDRLLKQTLSRDELAKHMQRYAEEFHLDVVTSATVRSAQYNLASKRWTVQIETPTGLRAAIGKHLVQATGVGSQQPYMPQVADRQAYKGISMHSADYKNPQASLGAARRVAVVGAASTAWDIVRDLHKAGAEVVMVARSPIYILPFDHISHPSTLGLYNFNAKAADALLMAMPTFVDAQIGAMCLARLAAAEPDRYMALAAAGFPVVDSAHPSRPSLQAHLIERGGGHYVDTCGATDLVAQGKVGLKAGVEPVAFVETGLRLSDGSAVQADAVVWCTGFRDRDARKTAVEVLGGRLETKEKGEENTMGPSEVAAGMDGTWGVDGEGEIRGMWKRALGLEQRGVTFWVTGGHTQFHRYHSATLALQIKAELEGLLPPAYRKTPVVSGTFSRERL
ncbi:hypothetical protein RB598_006395 [Gaeumannomyces tritici]